MLLWCGLGFGDVGEEEPPPVSSEPEEAEEEELSSPCPCPVGALLLLWCRAAAWCVGEADGDPGAEVLGLAAAALGGRVGHTGLG